MPISQCPRCELKFSSQSEMKWHLREDHPAPARAPEKPMTVTVPRPGGRAPQGDARPEEARQEGPLGRLWRRLRPHRRSP